ncbi:MAG: signal peptidase II [Christensenellaceae bacterium]|nr:signal peptidase II [Christensenellaceae bacterium]
MIIPLSIIFVFFVACDQLSKIVAVGALVDIGSSMSFMPGVLRFEYYRNTGMAWGLFPNAAWFFVIITVLIGGLIVFFIIKHRDSMPKFMQVSLTLILSGAVGNLIDRIFLGYVRDFIAFDFFSFPVFNIADSCVTIGAIMLAICLIFTKQGRDFFKELDTLKNTASGEAGVWENAEENGND